MKKKYFSLGVLSIALSITSAAAFADWAVEIEDDVFTGGQKAMLIGAEHELNGVVVDCSKDELKVTYIERSETKNITEGLPVEMIFKVDQSSPIKFDAQTVVRNNDYFGIESDDSDNLKLFLSQLRNAKQKILIGIRYPHNDSKASFTLSASGSTASVSKLVKACEIELPGNNPQKS